MTTRGSDSTFLERKAGTRYVDQNHYQAYWVLCHTDAVNRQFDQAIAASRFADLMRRVGLPQ